MQSKGYYKLVGAVLKENIAQGRIPPGTRLYTAAVADRLALSPPPVRRALDQLMEDGLLVAHHQHGYIVGNKTDENAPQGRENLHLLDLDLSLLDSGKSTPLAPRWEMVLKEVERRVLYSIPFGTFQISETGICDHFGVSRTVSREVLARLDVQGFVEKSRSSHWIVGPLSARTLDETHEMRRVLEPQAVIDASPRIDTASLEAMQTAINKLRSAEGGVAPEDISSLELSLHADLFEACRNRRMAWAAPSPSRASRCESTIACSLKRAVSSCLPI